MELESQVSRDSAEYKRVHKWLTATFGQPKVCVNPICKGISKKYEWAKRKGKTYATKRGHFIRLCTSCHRKYDMTNERKRKISATLKGRFLGNQRSAVKVLQGDKTTGLRLHYWPSITAAAEALNINKSGITMACKGQLRTSGGFKWTYLNK